MKDKLKSLGVKTWLRNEQKLRELLKKRIEKVRALTSSYVHLIADLHVHDLWKNKLYKYEQIFSSLEN